MLDTDAPRPSQDSDSEDDDYVPTAEADSESAGSDDESQRKRARSSSPRLTEEEQERRKKARAALWTTFQASVSTPPPQKPEQTLPKLVTIQKRYKFAGEDVVETMEVPEDSPEAKKWPLWNPPEQADITSEPAPSPSSNTDFSSIAPTPSSSHSRTATPPKSNAKRPGPRKSKMSLTSLPTSSSSKAKKLTTLDKSAMDWRAHINAEQGSGLKDELEANRRGGGYLEKVEFLKRVEERKEGVIEASKSNKRRRG